MKSSENKDQEQVINFTKIRQWYLPVSAEDYKLLHSLGLPMIRVHEDFLPTLRLITQPRKIRAKAVHFEKALLNPFLDALGEKWNAKKHRKATITNRTIKFETTDASIHAESLVHLQKIEASLRRFFSRWGYSISIESSESRGRRKLHCTYNYSGDVPPLVHLEKDTATLPAVVLKLGFIRLTLRFGDKDVEVNISKAAGGKWSSMDTSRCLYSQIGNVVPMLAALGNVINKDKYNAENSND